MQESKNLEQPEIAAPSHPDSAVRAAPQPEQYWVKQAHEGGIGFLPFKSKQEAIAYLRDNPGAKYAGTRRPENEQSPAEKQAA